MKEMFETFKELYKKDPAEFVKTALTAVAIFAFGYIGLYIAALLD